MEDLLVGRSTNGCVCVSRVYTILCNYEVFAWMQLGFDFSCHAAANGKLRGGTAQVWLLASDTEDRTPRSRRAFVRPSDGSSAFSSNDLVLLKGHGDTFHLYQSEQLAGRVNAEAVLDSLCKPANVSNELVKTRSTSQTALMLSFAPGRRRAPGVFGYDRDYECRTRFERLLHRLIDDEQVPQSEFAFLLEQALPYLFDHSHGSATALFLECYSNFLARSSAANADRELLGKAAIARHFAERCYAKSSLMKQAKKNRILASRYELGSKQFQLPGFEKVEPPYCNSGLIINRVAGFSFTAPSYNAPMTSSQSTVEAVFSYVGSAIIDLRNLLRSLTNDEQASQRIKLTVDRTFDKLTIAVGVQDEFSIFANVPGRKVEDPRTFMTDVWSSDLVVEPIETTRISRMAHIYEAPLPSRVRRISLNVSAALDRGEKRIARYDVSTAVGSSEVFY